MTPEGEVEPGDAIGGWVIEEPVAEHGVAEVFAARHQDSGVQGTLELLRRTFTEDADVVTRFTRDARALRGMEHEGLVPVLDAGKLDDGRPWMVTPRLEGRTLRDELAARGRLPPAEAWSIARALLDALAVAHPQGLVHRDLSAASVFLDSSGGAVVPRLFDFGLACLPAEKGDGRSDLYGVGVTLFEMLAGSAPFAAPTAPELLEEPSPAAPPSPRASGAPVGAGIDVFVRRLLAKDPADRFANAWAARSAGDHAFGRAPDEESAGAPTPEGAPASETTDAAPAAASPRRPRLLWTPETARRHVPVYLVTHALIFTVGVAVVVALGYAGPAARDVGAWMRGGGWTMYPIVASFLAAAALVPLVGLGRGVRAEAGHSAFGLAAAPALLAAVGTWLGWRDATDQLASLEPQLAFALFQRGVVSSHLPRFVGLALGALGFLFVCAMPTRRFRERRWPAWRTVDVAAIVLGAAAAAAFVAGAWSGGFVALVAAAATILGRGLSLVPTRVRFGEGIDHAVASIAATLLAMAGAFARLDARAAGVLVDGTATRAQRVQLVLDVSDEAQASRWVAGIALVIVLAVAAARLWHLRPLEGRVGLPRSTSLLVLGVPAFFALDAAQLAVIQARRDELAAAHAPRLELFAALDPPRAAAGTPLSPPSTAPALQATASSIAIDGRPVARTEALAEEATRDVVVQDLARALTASADARNRPDLALMVDRRAPWSRVVTLLRLARQAGAREVEVLLTRGEPPAIPPDAPPEAAAIVATDLVGLPIEIAVTARDEWEFATFEEATSAWQAAHADGDAVTVGVGW